MSDSPSHDSLAVRRVARIALTVGILLTVIKFLAFVVTDSVAVLSDALESIINVIAAGVLLYCLAYARRPADREHHYGHRKAEVFAVATEGLFILLAGLAIGYESVMRLVRGGEPERLDLGLLIVALLSAATLGLALFVLRRGRALGSAALTADGRHLLTDAVSTVAVLVGLGLVRVTGWAWLDPAVALGVGGLILFTGIRLIREAGDDLLDRADPQDQSRINGVLEAAKDTGDIQGYHKVRHRHAGPYHYVDLHIEVDPAMSVRDAHEVASGIEENIRSAIGDASVTTHIEPYPDPGRTPEAQKKAPE